jgi:hypothetical protein
MLFERSNLYSFQSLITIERLEKNPNKALTIQEEALKFFKENFCDKEE